MLPLSLPGGCDMDSRTSYRGFCLDWSKSEGQSVTASPSEAVSPGTSICSAVSQASFLPEPYTLSDHVALCKAAADRGQVIEGLHVQVRYSQAVCCARLIHAWHTSEGLQMWQVQLLGPFYGRLSTPYRNVRPCAFLDGSCTCTEPFERSVEGAQPGGACDTRAALPLLGK